MALTMGKDASSRMVTCIMGSGKMVKKRGKEYICIKMVTNMTDIWFKTDRLDMGE